ncbi:MAG TPA: DHA2 family efflux MFS transporter permease subunit [Ktedonobacteraceae bacterium]
MHFTYRWQATLVIALGLLMAILDSTIVSVALPQMATAFKTDYQTITWVATGYFLANAAIIPIVGYISDRIGSKTIFLLALVLFTLGSALCAFAPNEQTLLAFRVLQGIGGGALLPVAMAMIFRLFEPTERAGAIALLLIPLLLAPAFGPTLGGYLATSFSWNAIFTINLPIGIVAFILAALVLRGKNAEREANSSDEPVATGTQRFDWLGLVLAMVGFTATVYGLSTAGANGWGDSKVLSALIGGGVILGTFVVVELLVKDPVMDMRLFRNYTFTISNVLIWATTGILFGSIFLLPLFFERVQGLSALATGEIMIPQGLAMAVGLGISGKLYNRVGPRLLSICGAILVALSMLGFLHLEVGTTGASLQIWLILRGLGLGLVGQPLQTLAVSVVNKQQMARATSLMNSAKTVFGAVGVTVLTSYLTQRTTAHAQDALATCIAQAGQHAQAAALQVCAGQQAITMGMNDTFLLALIGCAICACAAIFVGRDPALEDAKEARKRGEAAEQVAHEPASMA